MFAKNNWTHLVGCDWIVKDGFKDVGLRRELVELHNERGARRGFLSATCPSACHAG